MHCIGASVGLRADLSDDVTLRQLETRPLGGPIRSQSLYRLRCSIKVYHISFILNVFVCGLAVKLPGCRSGSPGFDSRSYQISCLQLGLEWSPLSHCEDE
jgi:hypothetical protein